MTYRYLIILSPFIFILGIALGLLFLRSDNSPQLINPISKQTPPTPTIKPLLKYTFDNLSQYSPQASPITIEEEIDSQDEYTSYLYSYSSLNKKITGQLNIPNSATPSAGFPTILMIRGFIDPNVYATGMGTKNAAAQFASAGFVTIAPDFLGFGGSDNPAVDVIEARLEKPINILDLIASINTFPLTNINRMGIWGHSNGGQISLSILEITGKPYPTTLWAPVSKPFPYSILYYTDQFDDQGKALRKVVADFEDHYDVFDYSIDQYWHQITAPIQLHQGTADPDIPLSWSNLLANNLESEDINITYHTYPGADHNLRPSWATVVNRDITFFTHHLINNDN